MRINCNQPELLYSGRIDWTNPEKPIWIFPATSLRFRFVGKKATLWVSNRNEYWQNTLGAVVDGVQKRFDLNDSGETKLALLEEATDETHDILVFKRMDSCHEVTLELLELSENSRLLPPPEPSGRRMEVYGDSVSAGEVSEAVHCIGRPDPPHNGEFSNSWYSYAWIAARRLDAELHDIAQGGIALLDGTGWFHEPDAIGMESVWDKLHFNPALSCPTKWDFSQYVPQVVVVAIGQNDSYPMDPMLFDYHGRWAERWRAHYRDLLQQLRGKYPNAHIICCTTLLEHDPAWDRAVSEVCQKLADPKITRLSFRRGGRGTPGHLRIPEAEEMADELVSYIKSLHVEGWE